MQKAIIICMAAVLASAVLLAGLAGQAKAAVSLDERNALIDLYALTNGGSWSDSSLWNGAVGTECTWYGVTCGGGGTTVTDLSLDSNNLVGGIPPAIGNLTGLTELFLSNNQLTGGIPAEIGNLTNLTHLYLYSNQLTGGIPAEIGSLTAIQSLGLAFNQLTGSIPVEIGSLTALNGLFLQHNQLTGSIPTEIGSLTGLTGLYLANNQLTGSIPVEIGNLTALQGLRLHKNQLTGSIPAEIGNLTGLTDLKFHSNQLTGSIPVEIGNLAALTKLNLHANQLTGSIPTEIGSLTGLTGLSLYNNQLTGSIPAEIGNLTSLTGLGLNNNQLTGSIPVGIGNLTSLTVLYLSSNQLTGEVPAGIMNTVLASNGNYFGYNALYSTDGAVTSFLDLVQSGGNWAATQTLAPTNLSAAVVNDTSIDLDWTADTYAQAGGYEIWNSSTAGGPYSWLMNTVDKNVITKTITGLTPGTDYYFALKTWTDPHVNNDNKVTSDYSDEATAKTTGGECFIATAAYGSYSESHVMVLREFRDNVLLKSKAGTALVDMYYAYSPPIADFIAERPALRVATRMALAPVVGAVKHPGAALVSMGLLMGFVVAGAAESVRRGRLRRRK